MHFFLLPEILYSIFIFSYISSRCMEISFGASIPIFTLFPSTPNTVMLISLFILIDSLMRLERISILKTLIKEKWLLAIRSVLYQLVYNLFIDHCLHKFFINLDSVI